MKLLLKMLVSLSLVALIVWYLGGIGGIVRLVTGMNPVYAVLVFVVSTLDRALVTFKWALLLKSRRVHLPFCQNMKICCAALIWGTLLPVSVGADAVRAVNTARAGLDSNEIVASIIIERIVGFVSALVLGLFSLSLLYYLGLVDRRVALAWSFGIAALVTSVIAFALSFSQPAFEFLQACLPRVWQESSVTRRISKLHSTYRAYCRDKPNLAMFSAMTLGAQLIPIFYTWLIARGLGLDIGLMYVAAAMPLALLISRLPVSINGIGVFEGLFMLLMSLAGVSPSQAVGIALVGRVVQILSWLPWWLCYELENGGILRVQRSFNEN